MERDPNLPDNPDAQVPDEQDQLPDLPTPQTPLRTVRGGTPSRVTSQRRQSSLKKQTAHQLLPRAQTPANQGARATVPNARAETPQGSRAFLRGRSSVTDQPFSLLVRVLAPDSQEARALIESVPVQRLPPSLGKDQGLPVELLFPGSRTASRRMGDRLKGGPGHDYLPLLEQLGALLKHRASLESSDAMLKGLGFDEMDVQCAQILNALKCLLALLEAHQPAADAKRAVWERLCEGTRNDLRLIAFLPEWVRRREDCPVRLNAWALADLLRSELPDDTVRCASEFGVMVQEAAIYQKHRLALTAANAPGPFRDSNLYGADAADFGKGSMAAVKRVVYTLPDGTQQTMVFKAEDPLASSSPSDLIYITGTHRVPHFSCRNVATFRVDRLLELHLVPPTEFAIHLGQFGSVMALAPGGSPVARNPICLKLPPDVMLKLVDRQDLLDALASKHGFTRARLSPFGVQFDCFYAEFKMTPGGEPELDERGQRIGVERSFAYTVAQDFGNPALRRALVRLQWFDALCAQADRNAQNYFIHQPEDGGLEVLAIDNDTAWGPRVQRPAESTLHSWAELPELVDEDTCVRLLKLQPEALSQALTGLLTSDEIEAALERLRRLQGRLQELLDSGRVLRAVEDWAHPEASRLLGLDDLAAMVKDYGESYEKAQFRSYLLRDALRQAAIQAGQENAALFDPPAMLVTLQDLLAD